MSIYRHIHGFAERMPGIHEMKSWVGKWACIKFKRFCAVNRTIELKNNLQKIFARYTFDKGLISKIYIKLHWESWLPH